jgi:hypothetical protein
MKALTLLIMSAVMVMPVTGTARPSTNLPSGGLSSGCYWYPGPTQIIQMTGDGVGDVLASINSPARRQEFAEEWLRVSKESVTKSFEVQKQWLDLQKDYMKFQAEMELVRLEQLRLQAEIERLHVHRLRLETEKLQLQQEIARDRRPETAEEPPGANKDSR